MGFLSGTIAFERFQVEGPTFKQFGPKHIKELDKFAISKMVGASPESVLVGFLAGNHLFDQDFALEKNIVNDTLHCGIRIDTNKIPAALKRAWLEIELAPLLEENPDGILTKQQRKEAKEAVEARCEEEIKDGRFRRMQQFHALWDGPEEILYIGSSSTGPIEHGTDLFMRAFDLKLERIGAGKLAQRWAEQAKKTAKLDALEPTTFHSDEPGAHAMWLNKAGTSTDFLGNEFLLWLWWSLEEETDTITLGDKSEVVVMMQRTLTLECPRGDSGKETITAEAPVRLPEALHALKFGKLPRKSGLLLVRHGIQYECALQAETFGVSGGRIKFPESDEDEGPLEIMRVDGLRSFVETLDLLYGHFLERRIGKSWDDDVRAIRKWLSRDVKKDKKQSVA